MDETKNGAVVRTRLLWQLAGRYEHFAHSATSATVRDRYLKVAERYRQRAEVEEQSHQQKAARSNNAIIP